VFLLRLPFSLFNLAWQSAFLALGQIWANKVRAVLTTIGIVIGVASVTAVIAALSGLKKTVLNEFEGFGTNKIFISPDWSRSWIKRKWTDVSIRPKELEGLLEHCPSVKNFTRVIEDDRTLMYGTKTEEDASVTGIDPAWHEIENRPVSLGRPFSLIDNEQGRPVCLIDDKTITNLGMPNDPVGQSLLISGRRYTVVGVVKSRTDSGMFGRRGTSSELFIPLTTAYMQSRWPRVRVVAACRSAELSEDARAELKFFLRRTRRVAVGDPDNFRIEAVQEFIDNFRTVASVITIVATGIVGISLLVGGVGIMNIMFVSVSERTREIGLRKAVGARPGAILLQFLIEAVMICLMGGLIGVLIGQLMTSGMTYMAKTYIPDAKLESAYIPLWAIALSFGFSAVVGLVFGMFPAIKAARLDPIEALRHE
jgi:putative ABC transport system permease protein